MLPSCRRNVRSILRLHQNNMRVEYPVSGLRIPGPLSAAIGNFSLYMRHPGVLERSFEKAEAQGGGSLLAGCGVVNPKILWAISVELFGPI